MTDSRTRAKSQTMESLSSHRRKKDNERSRVRDYEKEEAAGKVRGRGERGGIGGRGKGRRRGASLESERRIQAPRCNSCLRYASQSQLVPSSFWQARGSGVHTHTYTHTIQHTHTKLLVVRKFWPVRNSAFQVVTERPGLAGHCFA